MKWGNCWTIPIFICYLVAAFFLLGLVGMCSCIKVFYEKKGWPDEKKALNCWSFAMAKWLEHGPKKTYLIIKMSEHVKMITHVFFCKSIAGLQVEELKPLNKPKPGWRRFFHAFWHKSRVRKGIGEEPKKKGLG